MEICVVSGKGGTGKTMAWVDLSGQEGSRRKRRMLPEGAVHCALLATNTLKAAREDYLRNEGEQAGKDGSAIGVSREGRLCSMKEGEDAKAV